MALLRQLGNPDLEVASLSALSSVLRDQGDYPAALTALDEAENLQGRLTPDQEIEGDLLLNRAGIYFSQGRYQEARDLFQKALAAYRQRSIVLKESQALMNIGSVESALGNFRQALSIYGQVKKICRELGAATMESKAEFNIASIYIKSGDYQAGIRSYLSLLAGAVAGGDLLLEASIHANLGAAYIKIGDLAGAEAHFSQAFEIFSRLGNREGVVSTIMNRSFNLFNVGELAESERGFQEVLQMWSELGNEVMTDQVRINLNLLAALQGRSGEELLDLEQEVEENRKAGLIGNALRFSMLAGIFQLQHKDLAGALKRFQQIVAEAERINDPELELNGRTLVSFAHFLEGDNATALIDLDGVLALLNHWQNKLTLSEFKGPFLSRAFDIYALGALLNATMKKPEKAFLYAEQARARAFLDQVGNQQIRARKNNAPELIRQEWGIKARLAHLGEEIDKESRKPVSEQKELLLDTLLSAREEARRDYGTLLTRLKLENPEYATLVTVDVFGVDQVQQMLDERTTLIEYFFSDSLQSKDSKAQAQVLAWIIDRKRFVLVQLPFAVGDLKDRVVLFRNLVETRNPIQNLATELYQNLFAPLASHIRHRNVVIVPHGVLHFLPFAALWDEKGHRYLGDSYTLSFSPSATALKFARARKAVPAGPVLIVGNPDGSLPHAAEEARAVARLYGAEPLVGSAATEGAVAARSGEAGIIHLAAHAELNPINPLFTRIKLAASEGNDGNLEMHEVFGLDLSKTGLVVLSACSTQMGRLSAGDEIEGLTRAFLYAGTPAVMASLWNVDDQSTALFMERFYTHLRKGQGRAEALRRAQVEARRKFPHPYYWAAFVLTGDGR